MAIPKLALLTGFTYLLLSSCSNHKKEDLEASIRTLQMKIGASKRHLDERGAFIDSIKNFSAAKKAERRYDSLVNVQRQQSEDVAKMTEELTSFQLELQKLKN